MKTSIILPDLAWFKTATSKLSLRANKALLSKGLTLVAVFSLVVSSIAPSVTQAAPAPTIQICHQNGNGSYIQLEVNANGINGHEGHSNDIIPMPQEGCPSTPPTTAPCADGDIIEVTPSVPQGWSTADTRPGGSTTFITDATSPAPGGALSLTTINDNAAKAQFMHATNTPLSQVTDLCYHTKQNSASFNNGAPSYQLAVWLDGTEASFTTFVYEPYNNGETIVSGAWQSWDVDAASNLWSSRTVNAGGNCVTTAGAGGAPFYSLATLKANCPSAVVIGFGVNVGTYNPAYDTEVDYVKFNNTLYNFETDAPKVPVNVNINKVWANSNGTPLESGPDNQSDITITVHYGDGQTATCTYNQNNQLVCDKTIESHVGDTINITETGVPSGWVEDSTTTGDVIPTCPEDADIDHPCTATVVNKLATASPCGTELVGNGGFESPVVVNPNQWDAFPSGTANLDWSAKWVRTGSGQPAVARVELQRNVAGHAHTGAQLTELDSSFASPEDTSGSPDASIQLFQDFPTVIGKNYSVKFWTSPRPGQGSSENITKVEMGGTELETITEDGSNNPDTVWTQHTYTFTATSTLSRLSFTDMGAGNGLGGYLDDVSVKEDCSSDVTICKYDNHENPLSGWDVYLKGPSEETVVVNPDGVEALSNALAAGDYALDAHGSYVYRGDANADVSDAAYSKRLASDSVYGGPFVPWVRENDFPVPYTGWLGIQVNDSFTDWGSTYSPTHNYSTMISVGAGQMKFRILDDNYSDNSGHLTVDISPVLKATTGDNGCVTIKNVPYDEYTLGEVMQSGWSNVSGDGSTVNVNEPTTSANLVNKCDSNCVSQVKICKVDDQQHPLADWNVFVKGPKLETVTLNTNNSAGANSVANLTAGQQYMIVASGTWQNRGFETVDAKFTTPDAWATVLDAPTGGYPAQLLEAQIDQSFQDWGSYSTAHKYNTIYTGTGSTANFRVFDGDVTSGNTYPDWYGDNNGTLTFDIYPIYGGNTGEDGCITVKGVPYGDYTLDETMKDGWMNMQGKGDEVVVDTTKESYTLVNKCSPNGCDRPIPKLHLIKVVCDEANDITPNQDGNLPIDPSEIPGEGSGCARTSGWNFDVASNDAFNNATLVGPTGENGEIVTPISGEDSLLSAEQQTAITDGQLWVREQNQEGYDFGALRCYMDALNNDNLEYISLGTDRPADIYCIAYNVHTPQICIEQNPAVSSGALTEFKGLTENDPGASIDPSAFPMGTHANAVVAGPTGYSGAWDGGQNDPGVAEGGAVWISNDAVQPTNPAGSNPGQNGAVDTWRLFSHTFTIPADATSLSTGVLHFAADNHATAYLDGVQIGTSDSFSTPTTTAPQTLTPGTHVLKFVVKNDAFEPTNNPTGLIFNLDFTYCGSETTQGETHHYATGTKYSTSSETGVGDWPIYLTKQVADVNVDADSADGITVPALVNGQNYIVKVSGTYDAGDSITADAQYSVRSPNTSWTDLVQNYESYGPSLLDLQIDGLSPNWGMYTANNNHTYYTYLTGVGNPVNFKINDIYYPNNVGSLNVQIYKIVDSTYTESDGSYSFDVTDLAGNYDIVEGTQEGWQQASPSSGVNTIAGGADSAENDFWNTQVCNAFVKESVISKLFRTLKSIIIDEGLPDCSNGISGTKYSSNEDTLSGWTIYLDLNHDGSLNNDEPYTVTDESGNYAFYDLPTGTYYVREVNQEGWTQNVPGEDGNNVVEVTTTGMVTDVNFVNQPVDQGGDGLFISGKVYNDSDNHNGTLDSGEDGLQTWVIYADLNHNGSLDDGEPLGTSDSNGNYSINGLAPGCYSVREVTRSGWHETEPATDNEFTIGIGGVMCEGSPTVTLKAQTHWYDMFISTAEAAVFAGNFPGSASDINFGNIARGGSGGSGSNGGSGSTPLNPQVLGDSTNVPSDAGSVLGAATTLPRTGSPAWVLLMIALLAAPMYYFRTLAIKEQKVNTKK